MLPIFSRHTWMPLFWYRITLVKLVFPGLIMSESNTSQDWESFENTNNKRLYDRAAAIYQGRKLHFLLECRHVTQRDIADRLSMVSANISRKLKGERALNDDEIKSLCSYLSVSDEFFSTDDMPREYLEEARAYMKNDFKDAPKNLSEDEREHFREEVLLENFKVMDPDLKDILFKTSNDYVNISEKRKNKPDQ
jgi:transcriptional regulator with XRE-family HTH domain